MFMPARRHAMVGGDSASGNWHLERRGDCSGGHQEKGAHGGQQERWTVEGGGHNAREMAATTNKGGREGGMQWPGGEGWEVGMAQEPGEGEH